MQPLLSRLQETYLDRRTATLRATSMRSLLLLFTLVSVHLFSPVVVAQNPFTWNNVRYSCKCYEGDSCWPSAALWSALNATVEGNLQRVIPDPAVCYNTFEGQNTYNQAACQEVTSNWNGQQWQTDRTVSNHWVLWTNNSCLPTTNRNGQCTIGFLPRYVIMAKKSAHVKAGIDFARTNHVRFLIRNTGHDFMGRSAGYGSLAVNMQAFKNVTFHTNYTGPGWYAGSAATIEAGVQGRALLRLANQQNPKVAIVTGECPTVGFAGGYIQGGGHGPLASYYGMAADQSLSYEVITADGEYRTANVVENSDLFWALRGGGPSTFAAIISVTVKTFPDIPTAGVMMSLNTGNQDLFWRGFAAFHNLANHFVENGMFVYYELFGASLNIRPFVGPNMNSAKITQVLQPFYDQLRSLGIQFTPTTREYQTFFDLYIDMFQDETAGANSLVGGRLFTKQDISLHGNDIVAAIRRAGGGLIGHIVGPGTGMPYVDNAIHPAWRNGSSFSITSVTLPNTAGLSAIANAQRQLTNDIDGPIRAASPYGAAYVNEGNLEEPNWQTAYWGDNYPRLKELKEQWDPLGIFYARTTPGTELWEVVDYNRRLCKRL